MGWMVGLILLAGALAYLSSFWGVFVFDDIKHIVIDAHKHRLSPIWDLLSGSRRPVVDLSLGVNQALSGQETWSYHLLNLAVHLLAGLTLFGVIRRSMERGEGGEAGRTKSSRAGANLRGKASFTALAAALIWVVHPLQTQSVTYVIQRAESMMGLFFLLTLYCAIRSAHSGRAALWSVAAVGSCALGMGCKAVMVVAPVVILLYDRVYLSRSFGETLRRRWGLHLGLFGTWSVLFMLGIVQDTLDRSRTRTEVGLGTVESSPIEYLLTQSGVILHYLGLSLWPEPLCLDYQWGVTKEAARIIAPSIAIVALLLATCWALLRRPRLGFLGAWFFIILAPTSSVIPIKDTAFEHRMYLSLASVVLLGVLGANEALRLLARRASWDDRTRRRVAGVFVGIVATTFAGLTARRNLDYRSQSTMWSDIAQKRPKNARAHYGLGTSLRSEGRLNESVDALNRAIALDPLYVDAWGNLCITQAELNQPDEAEAACREALKLYPAYYEGHYNLGAICAKDGRFAEAEAEFRAAIEAAKEQATGSTDLVPVRREKLAPSHYNLGFALEHQGRYDEALEQYRTALRILPGYPKAQHALDTIDVRRPTAEGE